MITLSERSNRINTSTSLVEVKINDVAEQAVVVTSTNHVFCCDVSGSMYGSLGKMREHLKNSIPTMCGEEDTVTIIAFASRNCCTVLQEMVHINSLADLKKLNTAIDRYLVPSGCTCFLDPVEESTRLINKNSGNFNWVFLSDGGNNDCPWKDVVNALTVLADKISSSVIIEYGYWADTDRLNEMAEILGGAKVNADNFDSYLPIIETAFKSKAVPAKEIDISGFKKNMRYQQFMYLKNKMVYVISSEGKDKINVPVDVNEIYYISRVKVGKEDTAIDDSVWYAMAYVCAQSLRYDVTEQLLAAVGDVRLIKQYCNSYGKQKLFELQTEILEAVNNKNVRFTDGKDTSFKPDPKAYCVIDVLNDITDDDDNLVFILDKRFVYNRTGAKTTTKVALTEEQTAALAKAKSKKAVDKIMNEVSENEVKMTMIPRGYPLTDFVWNEDRANLSAMFTIGVDLELPKSFGRKDPLRSKVYRNYTIIKDGILNVSSLPVKLTDKTIEKIKKKNASILSTADSEGIMTLDLSILPVINRKIVDSVKMKEMTEKLYDLMYMKNALKYLGYLKKQYEEVHPTVSMLDGFTEEECKKLNDLGITEKGYSPLTETEKSGDSYMALTFKTAFAKFSSIPKIEDIEKKEKAGKALTPSETFLKAVIDYVETNVVVAKSGKKRENAVIKAFKDFTIRKRKLGKEISISKFGLILSRSWFKDKKSMDENTDTFKVPLTGQELDISYEFTETKQAL